MISLSATSALLLYLGGMMCSLFFLWGRAHHSYKKKAPPPPLYHCVQCEYCCHPFLEKPTKKIIQCPVCQLLSKVE